MRRVLLLFFTVGLASCAAVQPPPAPSAAPANLSDQKEEAKAAPPGSPATCDSAECEDACKDAGELIAACAEAFELGCFSDVPPSEEVCDWRAAPARRRAKSDELESDARQDEGVAAPEENKKEARPKDVVD